MAEGIRFVCSHCANAIEAWSDGNPYYYDEGSDKKRYAYHPNHELLDRCVGVDSPHLCLECSEEFMVDSRFPICTCPNCKSREIADQFNLEGRRCPACKKGAFTRDRNFHAIS